MTDIREAHVEALQVALDTEKKGYRFYKIADDVDYLCPADLFPLDRDPFFPEFGYPCGLIIIRAYAEITHNQLGKGDPL